MSKELKTGIVSILIIAVFVWGYNYLKGQDLFQSGYRTFYIEYDNIQGLNEASTVSIYGLKVGRVMDINFNEDPQKKGKLVVKIALDNDIKFSKKSIAKIYSTNLLGGNSLAIIPDFEGELAESGDYLIGEVESDLIASVGQTLNPLKAKLERVIIEADSLLLGLNQILDQDARNSLNKTIKGLETTVTTMNKTIENADQLLESSKSDLKIALGNTKKISENFVQLSDSLNKVDLNGTVRQLQTTLNNVNTLIDGINKGEGTLGKLAKDEAMYTNLTKASKELEELLRDMKLNPKRFVHFSLFGKKPKPYDPEAVEGKKIKDKKQK